MAHRDWLIDVINDSGRLAWVRVPVAGQAALRLPADTLVYWDRTGQDGELYLLISHPDLPRVYRAEDIPTMRPVWGELAKWEAV